MDISTISIPTIIVLHCFLTYFLYSYEAKFIQGLMKAGKKFHAQQFHFIYNYTDDVSSLIYS